MPISAKDRIIFALDVKTMDEAGRYVELLKDHVGVFKVGLELFIAEGPAIAKAVKKTSGKKLFLDLKLHDIPETVRGAMRSASTLGADFVTIHCDGKGLMRAAVEEGAKTGVKVLGVTVLTSLSQDDMKDAGIDARFKDPLELVLHRARSAKEAGCAGIVCSGMEAGIIKKELGRDFLVISPGIRSSSDPIGDQKRVTTPYEAITNGADYIVVGRPIRNAKDPKEAALMIAGEIEKALSNR